MLNSSKTTPIHLPDADEDRRITEAALADPDAQPLTEQQLARMMPACTPTGRHPLFPEQQHAPAR